VLAQRLTPVLATALGKENVEPVEPVMASEDYSYFVEAGIPSFFYSLGGADPQKYAQAQASGIPLPSNHSPLFAPDAEPALRTAMASEVAVLRNLLSGSAETLRESLARKGS
jgi:metal-dependent amidase/aminoacylase/carboxypeptidase family protein